MLATQKTDYASNTFGGNFFPFHFLSFLIESKHCVNFFVLNSLVKNLFTSITSNTFRGNRAVNLLLNIKVCSDFNSFLFLPNQSKRKEVYFFYCLCNIILCFSS